MIKFKKLEKNDCESINKYLLLDKTKSCEKTVGALMMWRDFYNILWAVYDETLIIKYTQNHNESYLIPIGKNVKGSIEMLGDVTFVGVCDDDVFKFFNNNYEVIPNRDNFDYIYNADDLRYFNGKKLHSKKNFLNRFKSMYNYQFLLNDDKNDMIEFFKMIDIKQPHHDETGVAELNETIDLIENSEKFHLHRGSIRVDGKIIAACVGSVIYNTLYVHIEKADKEYIGSYQAIVSEFAKAFPNVEFVNREDDLGEEGLRKSKLSYKPIYLLSKNTVRLKN